MMIEVSLQYAGAAALLANAHRVQLDEVYVCEWSVTIMLDKDLVEHRSFAEACKRQGLLYREDDGYDTTEI